jgi:hypothetical protein
VRRVANLAPHYVVPNHYDRADHELHRRKFDALVKKVLG